MIPGVLAVAGTPDNAVVRLADSFGIQTELLVAQMINFCLVSYLLYRFAIKPVLKTIEERKSKIAEGLKYTEDMKAQLASAEQERLNTLAKAQKEAQALLAKTKADCELYTREQTKATEVKMARLLEQSQNALVTERAQLLSEVRHETASLAVAATEKLLSSILTDDMRQKLNQKAATLLAEKEERGTQAESSDPNAFPHHF